ncbi:MAG TPA: YoaK family protein [Acidobacteriaceae bacterium]|nr:YoaK family protein [Acidobacteriaceae bacterium]
MEKVPPRGALEVAAALLLVAVGGYGDAASFLLLHIFTGHVTGNTVLAAIAFTARRPRPWDPVLAVSCFLTATAFAQRMRFPAGQALGGSRFRYVLLLEIALLSLGPLLFLGHRPALFIAVMCLSLGLQNGALSQADGVGLHTTYLSGNLTHLMRSLVAPGDAMTASRERRIIPVALCGFVAGAACGSLMVLHAGPRGVWGMPVLLLAVLGLSFL